MLHMGVTDLLMFGFTLKSELNDLKGELQQRIVTRKHKLKEIRSSLKVFQVSQVM